MEVHLVLLAFATPALAAEQIHTTVQVAVSDSAAACWNRLSFLSERLRRLATFGTRGDREKSPKGVIDRLRIWKSLGQFRIKEHHIGSAAVSLYVLAPHAAGKVVLRPHLNSTPLRRRFLHTFVS